MKYFIHFSQNHTFYNSFNALNILNRKKSWNHVLPVFHLYFYASNLGDIKIPSESLHTYYIVDVLDTIAMPTQKLFEIFFSMALLSITMAAITFFSSVSMKIVYQIYRLFLQLEFESHKINQALFYNSHTYR